MKRIVSLLLILLLLALPVTAQATQSTGEPLDVVLVSDASGSMAWTDSGLLRVDAARLLMEILPAGSRVGGIVFNGSVTGVAPLVPKNTAAMENITSLLADQPAGGYTNIGGALEHALGMVEGSENPAVILLTDGDTQMDSEGSLAASLETRDRALATARARGVPIYGVALNANGHGDVDELISITDACVEVTSAADLEFAYSTLASFLQGCVWTPEVVDLPYTGSFRVPAAGVTEVNLVVIGSPQDLAISITRPDGTALTPSQLSAARTVTSHCTLLKLTEPLQQGLWHYAVTSSTAVTVSTHLVYNSDFQVEVTLAPAAPSPGQAVSLNASITHQGVPICDDDFTVTVLAANADTGALETLALTPCGDVYTAAWTPADKGTYYLTATATLLDGAASRECQPLTVTVADRAPVPAAETQAITRWSGPLAPDTQVDLTNWFQDPEGQPLIWATDIPGADLENAVLTLTPDTPVGIYRVTAADSNGSFSFTELEVKGRSTWLFLVPAVILVLALLALLALRHRSRGMAGAVTVQLDMDGELRQGSACLSGHRMLLSALLRQAGLDCPTIDPKACFLPTPKGPALDDGSGHPVVLRTGEPLTLYPGSACLTVTLGGGDFTPVYADDLPVDVPFQPDPNLDYDCTPIW